MRIAYYLPIGFEEYVRQTRVDRVLIREELNELLEEENEAIAAARAEGSGG